MGGTRHGGLRQPISRIFQRRGRLSSGRCTMPSSCQVLDRPWTIYDKANELPRALQTRRLGDLQNICEGYFSRGVVVCLSASENTDTE
eukprot:scaffold328790_cov53-Tisochrysis_lutea.AAC.1